jgi:hypothetical protein
VQRLQTAKDGNEDIDGGVARDAGTLNPADGRTREAGQVREVLLRHAESSTPLGKFEVAGHVNSLFCPLRELPLTTLGLSIVQRMSYEKCRADATHPLLIVRVGVAVSKKLPKID